MSQYFIGLGLLTEGRVSLAQVIVEHYLFEIKHYKKVLNGTQTYVHLAIEPLVVNE